MALLVHLDGPPGVGKSTIAQLYVDRHPGTLNCDVDRLRVLVGGWRTDFAAAGATIRPVALAMIRAQLDGGGDVVLPQMLASEAERARFVGAARDGDHDYVRVLLRPSPSTLVARFHGRPVEDPALAAVREVVDAAGGAAELHALARRLEESVGPADVVVDADRDLETVYRDVVAALRRD